LLVDRIAIQPTPILSLYFYGSDRHTPTALFFV